MLLKMKEIKAHYNKQTNVAPNPGKSFAAKISELSQPNKQ